MTKRKSNLIPNSERTPSERRKIARSGGLASGAARRERSSLRKELIELLDIETDCPDGTKRTLKERISLALIEKAISGDVAAFKIFRPILKYTATFFAAILIFGMISSTNLGAVPIFTIAAAVTAVVYFASEMLIRKTVKVFGSYKGYLGFAVVMAIFISIFAYTDIFGYEHRIPDSADIESASIYHRYSDNIPMVEDDKPIEDVRTLHAELTSDIPVVDNDLDRYSLLRVRYNLKNGKVLERAYKATEEVHERAISKMYENTEYKNIVYSFDPDEELGNRVDAQIH